MGVARNGCLRHTESRMHEQTLSNAHTRWRSAGDIMVNCVVLSGAMVFASESQATQRAR